MSFGTTSTARPVTSPALESGPIAELTSKGKLGTRLSMVSLLFLSQVVAYNIGDFPVSLDFVCYALFALYLLTSKYESLELLVFFTRCNRRRISGFPDSIFQRFHFLEFPAASSRTLYAFHLSLG